MRDVVAVVIGRRRMVCVLVAGLPPIADERDVVGSCKNPGPGCSTCSSLFEKEPLPAVRDGATLHGLRHVTTGLESESR